MKPLSALAAALLLPTAVAYAAATNASNEQAREVVGLIEADAEQKELAATPLKEAKDALQRALDARAAGDESHAALLDELALEWAGTARDLVRSVELEEKSAKVEKDAAEVQAKAVRAVAIIEEAVARKGRAEDQLQSITAPEPSEEQQ